VKYSEETLAKVLSITGEFGTNANVLVELFGRLDPLAAGRRGKRKELNLNKVLQGTFQVFERDLHDSGIVISISCPKDLSLLAWEQDIYAIMTNLIDNSIFWLNSKKLPGKEISVFVTSSSEGLQYIDYRDTGPGIEDHLIESEVIFEPDFSTKPEGTGLGLAIAGEAANRNGLELKAFSSATGAYFRLQQKEE
jgi:signal transduction histidine kinase